MMGCQNNDQDALFYEFRLDEAVPDDHLVRKIDGVSEDDAKESSRPATPVFNPNQIGPGSHGPSQPPKNNVTIIADARIMLAYSPMKNSANLIELYSTL